MGLGIRRYVRTYEPSLTTDIFKIDGLPNFLRYEAPLVRAGAPLLRLLMNSIRNRTGLDLCYIWLRLSDCSVEYVHCVDHSLSTALDLIIPDFGCQEHQQVRL